MKRSRFTSALAIAPLAASLAAGLGDSAPAANPTDDSLGVHAVVTRDAVLHSGPSSSSARVATVREGAVVTLLPHGSRSGYLRVQTQDEDVGWITVRSAHPLDPTELTTAATEHTTVQNGDPVSLPSRGTTDIHVATADFDGCPLEGNPSPNGSEFDQLQTLNRKKNRFEVPTNHDIDSAVTLAKMLEPSIDDSHRWADSKAAEITAYVYRVIPGGRSETTNCRKTDPAHRDSHIELVLSLSDTEPVRRVIAEVTPRWRQAVLADQVDWSTATLQQSIQGKQVKIRGWMLFDSEHKSQAENTNRGNESNWRATAWEIHPVSSIVVIDPAKIPR